MAGKNAVMFGLEPAYLWSCCEEFQISKGTLKLPTLEKITKVTKALLFRLRLTTVTGES